MSDARLKVQIVFRQALFDNVTTLDCEMTEAEHARLRQEFASLHADAVGSTAGEVGDAPTGGIYQATMGGLKVLIPIRFADVRSIT